MMTTDPPLPPSASPTTTPVVVIPSDAQISINQEVINQEIEEIFLLGLRVAKKHLRSGIASLEAPMARAILTASIKMIGQGGDSQTAELRRSLDAIWEEMRDGATPDPAPTTVDNPNEIPGVETPRP